MYERSYTYLSRKTRKKEGILDSGKFTLAERVSNRESGGLSTTQSV
jgi:hypothetical protein